MTTPIKIRRSGTASSTPSSLDHGELAINYADATLFWKDSANVIQSFVFQEYASATHKSQHATGGSDALTPGDIGAAPAASPTFTGVITVSAGTAAAPALVFSGDSNTGIAQLGGADSWSVVTGGVEQLRVASSAITLYNTLNTRLLQNQSTANLDTAGDVSGFSVFYSTSVATGKPPGFDHAVATYSFSNAWQVQDAGDWRTNARYIRTQNNGVWTSWERVFADNYHPNADKWTTARTISLTGAVTGSASVDGSANASIATTLASPITEGYVNNGNTGTAKTIALTNGTLQDYTLTGNCTFTMPTATAGQSFTLMLRTGAGSYTATFTGVKWPGSTPVVTTTASRMDLFTFVSDGTNWYGNVVQGYTP